MDGPLHPLDPAPFELTGGDLCLDFVNTWGDRSRPETDQLRTYAQLLAFARQTRQLTAGEAEELAALAGTRAATAAAGSAQELREALYGIFSARAQDQGPAVQDLACLNRALREALPHLCVEGQGTSLAWRWRNEEGQLTAPLWPIARAAADLLTSATAAPVRECGGDQCTWLFLDQSRGQSRRWCSMASCGNRAKARRHYHRNKAAGE
jgi:predicted RNA-binding Zn ribbon-like protein